MVRKPIIIANWKMNKTIPEAIRFVEEARRGFKDISSEKVDIVLAPPFTALKSVSDVIGDYNIHLGAQNLFWEDNGAFTGEISASMLVDSGCSYVIIGHSERRKHFGETDEGINRKIQRALSLDMIPVFCVGETLEERENGATFKVVRSQVEKGSAGLSEEAMSTLTIAYEPVWAIGTGKTATPEQAEEVHGLIRSLLRESYGRSVSEVVRILYGGSVTPDNISSLMNQNDIDGALVGGASLKADSFVRLIAGAIM